ncbi:serine/threonine-protein kinase VRK1-like [Tropilaelaps mercedesae]|uniref:non-specific serine/threonine protein kinase n=1 Tax=Tropilaelaps mercedesae TaxID=418985 RepID=A0A1V9XZL5_9ACAR|nr:serine/threonine-protein kinase VRK1-like [Tropilaelaps mercedesae]
MPPKKQKPVALPAGNVVKDGAKVVWRIGKLIGKGGFGEVFLCEHDTGKAASASAPYVIKIEPSGSGPLFVEMHCYMRVAGKDQITAWVSKKKLDYLGMPVMHSKGTYEIDGVTYRYIVLDRYAGDLEGIWKQGEGTMPVKTALTTAIRVLDVLEYLHENSYIHADIKASNIMLGLKDPNKVYLLDFGLACKFESNGGEHKAEKQDKKKMHNGTIEYTSRDAHRGMDTRRTDIEILGFNLLHWLTGKLPWLKLIKDCKAVAASKESHMTDVKKLVTSCFGTANKTMVDFMSVVEKMGFADKPDYEALRRILKNGLIAEGFKYDGKIDVSPVKAPKGRRRTSDEARSMEDDLNPPKRSATSPARNLPVPKSPAPEGTSDKRAKPSSHKVAASKPTSKKASVVKKPAHRKPATGKTKVDVHALLSPDSASSSSSLENMTPAMKAVYEMKKEKDALKARRVR